MKRAMAVTALVVILGIADFAWAQKSAPQILCELRGGRYTLSGLCMPGEAEISALSRRAPRSDTTDDLVRYRRQKQQDEDRRDKTMGLHERCQAGECSYSQHSNSPWWTPNK